MSGRTGYAEFINGFYELEVGVVHDERPSYRSAGPIAGLKGNSARYLYMYYNSQNQAWAISQNLGSNGIIAFAVSQASTPENLRGATWRVANHYGEFIQDDNVTCG